MSGLITDAVYDEWVAGSAWPNDRSTDVRRGLQAVLALPSLRQAIQGARCLACPLDCKSCPADESCCECYAHQDLHPDTPHAVQEYNTDGNACQRKGCMRSLEQHADGAW
jgi:hypothetical protein